MARTGALYILFAELPAGSTKTFASAQRNIQGKVAVWFFNLASIVDLMATAGYSILLDSKVELGHNQENLPVQNRITDYHTLLFQRRPDVRP
jgi:hypothetical protein